MGGGGVRGYRGVVVGQVAGVAAADVDVTDVDRGGCIRGRYGTCKERRTWRRREMPRRGWPRMYQMRMRVQTVAHGSGIATRVTTTNNGRHRRDRELIVVLLPIGSSSATKITVVMVLLLLLVLILLVLLVGRGRVVFPRGRNRFRLDLHRREGGGRGGRGAVGHGQVGQTARVLPQRVHRILGGVSVVGSRRTPRGDHAQVGIDGEVLRPERSQRRGVVGQTRDGRLEGYHRRVEVRLLPRVLHVGQIVISHGRVHRRRYHDPQVGRPRAGTSR